MLILGAHFTVAKKYISSSIPIFSLPRTDNTNMIKKQRPMTQRNKEMTMIQKTVNLCIKQKYLHSF